MIRLCHYNQQEENALYSTDQLLKITQAQYLTTSHEQEVWRRCNLSLTLGHFTHFTCKPQDVYIRKYRFLSESKNEKIVQVTSFRGLRRGKPP